MVSRQGKLAILCGGGPAPGLNSVISAATIRARLEEVEVLGVQEGFRGLMAGDPSAARPLEIADVSRIHFRGGSMLGISRANPTKRAADLETCVRTLTELGVDKLVTIGGDDTAFSAMNISKASGGALRVVHVPKTIDNDLDLPPYVDTFGFQTARHVGAELVKNLMVDAYTTSRWYFVVAMGRKAGHLALGIGKAAGATVTLIPEEWGEGMIPLASLVDTLALAVVKRLAEGRRHGVAVLAEGLVLQLDPATFEGLDDVELDEHGHVRIAEIDLGDLLKKRVRARLEEWGISATIVSKDIGYELRCADPIPMDMEYTRDLGYCAVKYLLDGGESVMVSLQGGQFVPVPFSEMLDPATGRTRVRLVDVHSTRYAIARRYMIRLRRDDFEDTEELGRLAATVRMTPQEFRERFFALTDVEPATLNLTENRA